MRSTYYKQLVTTRAACNPNSKREKKKKWSQEDRERTMSSCNTWLSSVGQLLASDLIWDDTSGFVGFISRIDTKRASTRITRYAPCLGQDPTSCRAIFSDVADQWYRWPASSLPIQDTVRYQTLLGRHTNECMRQTSASLRSRSCPTWNSFKTTPSGLFILVLLDGASPLDDSGSKDVCRIWLKCNVRRYTTNIR
jgi:hypothetical protein